MVTTRVFKSGNSQAVRIPKEYAFDVDEVEIERCGDDLVLRPRLQTLAEALERLPLLDEPLFPNGRQDDPPQEREWF